MCQEPFPVVLRPPKRAPGNIRAVARIIIKFPETPPTEQPFAMASEITPIVKRALAFTETLNWENPTVLSTEPADDDIIATYGTLGHTGYMAVTIEMRWSRAAREHILSTAAAAERPDTERILDCPMVVVVTCSETDIIHHHFPGVDLD